MRPGLRSWLRALPLQRRVAFLTTVAVALAVAITSVAGYVTLRVSLYRALDAELVDTAAGLARGPAADDLRTIGNLTDRSVRADNLAVAAVRADGSVFFVPDASEQAGARTAGAGHRPAAAGLLRPVRGDRDR